MSQVRPRIFIKFGGSLITDKRAPEMPRRAIIERLAGELAAALREFPGLDIVLGHGSGSFGHVVGRRYGTRAGVHGAEGWYGFAATADAAARLNRIVVAALLDAGVPAWGIQPGVALRAEDGVLVAGPEATVDLALARGLLPVVYGDVVLDWVRGGTIASTEEIFARLATALHPRGMVLMGEVDGIFTADPQQEPDAVRIPHISRADFADVRRGLGGSYGVDVTGGMLAKVEHALEMIDRNPGLEILIAGGLQAGSLVQAVGSLTAAGGEIGPASTGTLIYG